MSTSNKIILASIIFTTLFTIVAVVTQYVTGQELSSTLITCVFAYWGTEMISLCAIRRKKLDVGYGENYESCNESYEEELTEEEGV